MQSIVENPTMGAKRREPRVGRVMRARSLAVAVVIATALASGIPALPGESPRPVAAYAGANGLIVWQRTDHFNQSEIWTMRANGTGKTQLTRTGNNQQPSWSPDGKKIVFVSSRDGTAEIYVMDADGANPTRLTNNGDYEGDPVFSPDGTKIAFEAFASTDYEIYVMNADGSGAANITNNAAEDRLPKWKPDGSRIAFQSNRDGAAVYLMSPTGTNLFSLTPPTAGDYGPAWSPDGSKLVFSRNTGTPATSGLYVTDHFDGTHQSLLTQDATMPAWSPEGDRIVFMTGRDFNPELYLMDADGSNHVRLTNDDAIGAPTYEDWFPDWQPAAVRVSPSTLSYGEAKVGTVGSTLDVTLKAGVAPITITSIVLAGSNPGEFAITQETCTGTPIAAGGTCTASVRFQPSVLGVRTASLVMAGPAPMSTASVVLSGRSMPFAWGSLRTPGPNNTWNDGAGLARTVSTSATNLHTIYTTDRINGTWVTDGGPHVGAYYVRSTDAGATWSTPKRLNPSGQHGSRVAIAASDASVYTAWVSTTKWVHFRPGAPRILYFRRNTDHGASTAWSSTIRLTSTSGRVDFPVIAASGAYVYVTYTNSVTGSIKLAISSNRGRTWKTVTVGSTTRGDASGRQGIPTVAADGSIVGVSWVAGSANSLRARLSTSNGSTWKSEVTLGKTAAAPTSASASGRLGFAWVNSGSVRLRTWTTAGWGTVRTLPQTDGYSDEIQQTATIALNGSAGVAVAYAACVADCSNELGGYRTDLIWRPSNDDGASWGLSSVIATGAAASARRANTVPSVAWAEMTKPIVVWNGWTAGSLNYRLYLRVGA